MNGESGAGDFMRFLGFDDSVTDSSSNPIEAVGDWTQAIQDLARDIEQRNDRAADLQEILKDFSWKDAAQSMVDAAMQAPTQQQRNDGATGQITFQGRNGSLVDQTADWQSTDPGPDWNGLEPYWPRPKDSADSSAFDVTDLRDDLDDALDDAGLSDPGSWRDPKSKDDRGGSFDSWFRDTSQQAKDYVNSKPISERGPAEQNAEDMARRLPTTAPFRVRQDIVPVMAAMLLDNPAGPDTSRDVYAAAQEIVRGLGIDPPGLRGGNPDFAGPSQDRTDDGDADSENDSDSDDDSVDDAGVDPQHVHIVPPANDGRPKVLVVIDESGHGLGGVPVFNLELTNGLSADNDVTLLTVDAHGDYNAAQVSANHGDVSVVNVPPKPGQTGEGRDRLMSIANGDAPPKGLGRKYDFVLGHSRFSGPAADKIRENFYPEAKLVHFLHTSPLRLDVVKKPDLDPADATVVPPPADAKTPWANAYNSGRRKADIDQSVMVKSDLVVGVGELLTREADRLSNRDQHGQALHALIPGSVAGGPRTHTRDPEKKPITLLLSGRATDPIKGVEGALKAVWNLRQQQLNAAAEGGGDLSQGAGDHNVKIIVRGGPAGVDRNTFLFPEPTVTLTAATPRPVRWTPAGTTSFLRTRRTRRRRPRSSSGGTTSCGCTATCWICAVSRRIRRTWSMTGPRPTRSSCPRCTRVSAWWPRREPARASRSWSMPRAARAISCGSSGTTTA